MKRKHVGARSELLACAWLIANDYEVFRNVSPFGLIDLIGLKMGKIYKFDVTTANENINGKRLHKEQIDEGVIILIVHPDGNCEINSNPQEVGNRKPIDCRGCSKSFKPTNRNQLFCSTVCRHKYKNNKYKPDPESVKVTYEALQKHFGLSP